jgi:LysR family transcriptional regulator, transcriptional activator of nhaA
VGLLVGVRAGSAGRRAVIYSWAVETMRRLNYHHLFFFWTVAREGTIARACAQLHLTQPTISGHLRALERTLGHRLFLRAGRTLALTATGREVFRYAEEIFALGQELEQVVRDGRPERPTRLLVGVADTLPKEVAYRLIEPALGLPEGVQVVCDHGPADELLARLAVHALDVILADAPANSGSKVRAYSHLLGECGLSFVGSPELAAAHGPGFPRSLDRAPFLFPAEGTTMRRSLDQWFDAHGVRPHVRGEFSDVGLLKVFGQNGAGLFAIRTAVEAETQQQYGVQLLGRAETLRERFYAITAERRVRHPAVLAITAAARERLFVS